MDGVFRRRESQRAVTLVTPGPRVTLHGSRLTYAQTVSTLRSWVSRWDEEGKAGINFRKHGVRMPEAIPVFDDPCAITITDEESDPSEQRFVTLGMGAAGRLLVVVYTWRGKNVRIISARPAEAREREE